MEENRTKICKDRKTKVVLYLKQRKICRKTKVVQWSNRNIDRISNGEK